MLAARQEHQGRASLGESFCHFLSEPARPAGNQRNFSGEIKEFF
jgi:hypothetical protein